MKKALSCILILALLFGLAATVGAEFYDETSFPDKRRVAINYAAGKSFKSNVALTRAQAAKILCVAIEGAEKAAAVSTGESGFADVPASNWASGYVAWCAQKNIVAGVGAGKFNPDGKLSSAAFAKMLLVAYGHDPQAEGLVGADWIKNTDKALKASGAAEGFAEVTDAPLNRGNACQLVYNFVRTAEESSLTAQGYPFTEFSLLEKNGYRTLGRTAYAEDGLYCDMAGSGIEFTLDCGGTIWATVETAMVKDMRLRAYVDGEMGDVITFTPGLKTQPLFGGIAPGVHTIRILNDVQPDNMKTRLISFSVCAKKETLKPTAQKSLYIEYVGDSITSGYGFYGPSGYDGSNYSVGPSYGRLSADLLDADFSIISRGGIGLQHAAGPGVKTTSDVLYAYQNYYRDKETKYDFARKPDFVVFALGTNDKETETYYDMTKKFFEQVRTSYNDPKLKIVIIHNMMTNRYQKTFEKIADEDPYVWQLKVPQDRKGPGHHPTLEGQAQYAQLLADFIKTIR